MRRRFSNGNDFIKELISIHGNRYDYSDVVYTNINSKISIKCKVHGAFEQTASSHLAGRGCKKCIHDKNRKTVEQFLSNAKKIHGERYDYSDVIYTNNTTKVIIKCTEHGKFEQLPGDHLNGRGCRKCIHDKDRKNINQFLVTAKKIHGEKYDYSDVIYINGRSKMNIKNRM